MRDPIIEALARLQGHRAPMSDYERDFIYGVTQRGCHSVKQQRLLATLVTRYLHDQLLAAEILGQERLFVE